MEKDAKILITGAAGMVGSSVVRLLKKLDFTQLLTPSHADLELTDARSVDAYFTKHQPDYVFMIAARVGGIQANMQDPAGFLTENLKIQTSLFSACLKFKTKKNLFLGSSCIYPRECPQPMKEESLLTGPLEPTNEGYALAKIAGLKMAQYYYQQYGMLTVCPMPCNIYGTNDHYDILKSHVLSALVKRFVDAAAEGKSEVTLWGSGIARREFVHVDDVAEAMIFLMDNSQNTDIVNVGTGTDQSIRELAQQVASEAGFNGEILWDKTKPDGMLKKCLDISRMSAMGFSAKITIEQGIRRCIQEYQIIREGELK